MKIRGGLKNIGQWVHMRNQILYVNRNIIFCFSFHCPLGSVHILGVLFLEKAMLSLKIILNLIKSFIEIDI